MPLESTVKYNKAALTHKALDNRTPDYITRLLFLVIPISQFAIWRKRCIVSDLFLLSSTTMELIVSGYQKLLVAKCF